MLRDIPGFESQTFRQVKPSHLKGPDMRQESSGKIIEARPLTPYNIEDLAKWCNGSIKGVQLPKHLQAIDCWFDDAEHRIEMGHWAAKTTEGKIVVATYHELLDECPNLIFNPCCTESHHHGVIADARRVPFLKMEEIAQWCGGDVVEPRQPEYSRGIRFWSEVDERWLFANANDWIIKTPEGEFDLMDEQQFRQCYQPHRSFLKRAGRPSI